MQILVDPLFCHLGTCWQFLSCFIKNTIKVQSKLEQVHSLCVDSRPGDRLWLAKGQFIIFLTANADRRAVSFTLAE